MKKLIPFLLLLAISVLLVACNSDSDSSKETSNSSGKDDSTNAKQTLLDKVKEEKVIKIGTEGTYMPFTFHDESGKLTGYDVEVAEEVGKRLGIKVEFYETQWDAIFAGLESERFDAIANQVAVSDERKEKYSFSIPYTNPSAVLVTHKDNTEIKSVEDIAGKKSAQTMTSNWAGIAESEGAEIVRVEGFNEAIQLVTSKRVDLTFNDELSVLMYQQEQPDAPLQVIPYPDYKVDVGFLFRQGNEELVAEFDRVLEEMKADGTLKELSEKWFGKDVS
ncbi:amino acid ABC transporter substrate-binding protein [Psychrobacillus sp. NPDC096623]|uniref:amino acid ABC transporter substrate-binding protein n=1 Tax=Psychrobacillus sp. NPDC096623 TaxID=3364492 RepID=UPI003808F43B